MPTEPELGVPRRRYERERKARGEAESIAERVTGELYATKLQLEKLNLELKSTNEELQAVNQALRDFVAIASHDLRGPLTSILGWTSTLMRRWEGLGEDKKKDYLAIVEREAGHMSRIVEDLLTISRIEAGALDTRAEVVELRRAVEQVIQDFAQYSSKIRVSLPTDLRVLVDADHLERILVNYVGNALKYGSPPVEVEARDAGEWVEIRVKDSGEGVPKDFVPRLFGRFARANTTSTREQKGTGLGLSIVQGLAQANGGETWYEPNVPRGSCFAVRLRKPAA